MQVTRLDHLVLTVRDIDATVAFYQRVLGMEKIEFAGGRVALRCGAQKINLHQSGAEFEPKAGKVMPGSGDRCRVAEPTARSSPPTCAIPTATCSKYPITSRRIAAPPPEG